MKLKDLKVLEETQKSIKRRWKFIEGRERPIIYSGLALAYVLTLVMIYTIYTGMVDRYTLQMKFDSEKSFNSVYMALSDSAPKAISTMADEGVSGVGIYSSGGQVYQRLGDAPSTLPIQKLVAARQRGDDSTLGIYMIDNDTKEIEYFRLSRLNVVLEMGSVFSGAGIGGGSLTDFPDIIYVKFDGLSYFADIRHSRLMTGISVILVTLIFVLIVNIYNNNRRYREELQKNESLAKLGAAARTLTHEIKNPLSAMTIQSALMRKLIPAEFKDDLAVMDHEIERLTNLTNRVSDFLRNPLGTSEEIELVTFISDIAALFQRPVKVNTVGLTEVTVVFDADRARSVFENLIKNATESCQDRDPEVRVEIAAGRHKTVSIKVMDRGDGLPKQARDKLFDPFFTTKIHGSGIGLAISKQFVEARGGSLRLIDRDGGGTIAEVILPCM